jgi:hypothetical protein
MFLCQNYTQSSEGILAYPLPLPRPFGLRLKTSSRIIEKGIHAHPVEIVSMQL